MGTVCKIDGCDKTIKARGYCTAHYKRLMKYGDPFAGATFQGEAKEFLEKSLEIETDECIFWPYAKGGLGYGQISVNRKKTYVHRIACEHANGPVTEDKPLALHSCGNGHLACFNPRHLSWGNHLDNSEDSRVHGTRVRGSRCGAAKLTEEQALDIYNRAKNGEKPVSLSKEFGINNSKIHDILNGVSWSWLTGHKKKGRG